METYYYFYMLIGCVVMIRIAKYLDRRDQRIKNGY